MSRELTNLLPLEKRRAFTREYFIRLATVGVLLLAVAALMGTAMLVPSYLAFTNELKEKEADVARLTALLESAQEKEVGERLTRLAAEAEHLKRLETAPSATGMVRAVLDVPDEGVQVAHIAYTPSREGKHQMTVSGSAATRSALQRYEQALGALPFVGSTDLPIGTYAKEADLEFIITLTGAETP